MLDITPRTHYNKFSVIHFRVWRSLVSRLVRVQEAVGSNPATRTTIGALKPKGFKAPILFSALVFPFIFPFCLKDLADVIIHPISAGLLHLLCYMAVDVQSKGCSMMAQVALDGLNIISCL